MVQQIIELQCVTFQLCKALLSNNSHAKEAHDRPHAVLNLYGTKSL